MEENLSPDEECIGWLAEENKKLKEEIETLKANRAETFVRQGRSLPDVACGNEHKFNNELHEMHPCIINLVEINGVTKFVKSSEYEKGTKYFREDFAKWKFDSKQTA